MSMTHLREIVGLLVKHSLVEIIPHSKVNALQVTEKGHRVYQSIVALRSELPKRRIQEKTR